MKTITNTYLTGNSIVDQYIVTYLLEQSTEDAYSQILTKLYKHFEKDQARVYFSDILDHYATNDDLLKMVDSTFDDPVFRYFMAENKYLDLIQQIHTPDQLSLVTYFLHQKGLADYKDVLKCNSHIPHLIELDKIHTQEANYENPQPFQIYYTDIKDNALACFINQEFNQNPSAFEIAFTMRRYKPEEIKDDDEPVHYIIEYINPELLDAIAYVIENEVHTIHPNYRNFKFIIIDSQPISTCQEKESYGYNEFLIEYIYLWQTYRILTFLKDNLEHYPFPKPNL